MGLLVLDYVVHKLSPIRHELLHTWRTFVACWIVLGKNLLCMILSPLLFWGCMSYIICSVPLIVLYNSHLLHVVNMILYSLAYCEWLFLSLVGLTVCGCNNILQICGCRLIGGEEFFIFWGNVDLLLPTVVICPTIEGGNIYLRCIVLLWSVFEGLNGYLCIIFSVITRGELNDNLCSWLSLSF